MQQLPKIFVPVSVKDRLPKEFMQQVGVIREDMEGFIEQAIFNPINGGTWIDHLGQEEWKDVETWLENLDNVIVCTKEELEQCWRDGESAGQVRADHPVVNAYLEEYFESKGIKL